MSGAPETPTAKNPNLDEILAENAALRMALKETILNVGGVVESAERVLKRAEGRLAAIRRDDEE